MSRTYRIEYVGGPLDGHVADVPDEFNAWAKWTDETGHRHFYKLEFLDRGPRFVYQPTVPS